jgi:hypothetical protein
MQKNSLKKHDHFFHQTYSIKTIKYYGRATVPGILPGGFAALFSKRELRQATLHPVF